MKQDQEQEQNQNNTLDELLEDETSVHPSHQDNTKTTIIGIVIVLLIGVTTIFSLNDEKTQNSQLNQTNNDQVKNGQTSNAINDKAVISPSLVAFQPQQALTQKEYQHLLYMREEEKLARDVYTLLHQHWGLSIFSSISKSEQRHTDKIAELLAAYNISDPALNAAYGVFQDQKLAKLYQELITKGKLSGLDALKVGALIEEVDINDLDIAIQDSVQPDILRVYRNIRNGSYHHLRAFVHGIELYGQTYQAQVLSQNRVQEIINSPLVSNF